MTGRTVTLTLSKAVVQGQTVFLSYEPPTSSPIRDADGIEAGPIANRTVVVRPVPPTAAERFTDISAGVWYESAVSWMILRQITSGCTTTMFCTDQNLTRQQFVTFLGRAAGRPNSPYLGSEAFTDVRQGVYAENSIGWAVANGITKGCTSGQYGDTDWQFCPTQAVTRRQMATLYRHVDTDHGGVASPYLDVEPEIFYAPGVSWLTDFQVVPGCASNLFCPDRDATRAEAALFING